MSTLADEGITPIQQDAPAQPPLPDVGNDINIPAPRAVSVAGPIPDAAPQGFSAPSEGITPISQSDQPVFVPPIVQNSLFRAGVVQHLKDEAPDQGFDDAVNLNMGDLKWPLMAFKGITPDVAAKVDELAKTNGLTYGQANSSKEDLEVLNQARQIYASLSATDDQGKFIYPNTIKWLQDPVNMAKSKDDVAALANIEDAVKAQQQIGESSWFQTARNAASGIEKSISPIFTIPAILRSASVATADQLAEDGGPLGQIFNTVTGNYFHDNTVPENPDWLSTFFGLTRAINAHADANDASTLEGKTIAGAFNQGDYKGAAQLTASNVASFLPTIAAAAVDPALGLTEGAGSSAGSQYQDDLDAGKSPDKAAEDAVLNAGVNTLGLHTFGAVGQLAKVKALFSAPVGRETATALWGRIARQAATSAFQGAGTQAAMQVGDAAADYATGGKDAFNNEVQKLTTAALLGFVADGTIAAPLGALEGLRQARQQEEGAAAWQRLTGSVSQSKLVQRDPDALADFVTQNLAAAGKPTTVGVDGDKITTFFQNDNQGFQKFASDMGLKPEDIANAAATGGEVALPIGPYQAKYAGSNLDTAINQDLRFTPGGLSANELKDQAAQVQQLHDSIKAELAKTVSGEGNQLPARIDAMRDKLMASKAEGGMGYSADQADSQLSVLMAGLGKIAAHRGESVEDTVNRLGLELDTTSEVSPNADGSISIRNQGGTDSEREAKRAALQAQPPVKVDTTPFDGITDQKQLRDAAKVEYRRQKALGPVTTVDGRPVQLSIKGMDKSLSHMGDARVARIIPGLRDLLEKATPLWSEGPKDQDPNVKAYHNYAAKASLDGNDVYTHMRIREDRNGTFHYDHDVSSVEEVENPSDQSYLVPNQGADRSGNQPADKNKLRQWWRGVKPEDMNFQGERGAISFQEGKTVIHLMKTADLSTFAHETGHLFVHEMQSLVAQGKGDESVRADLQTLMDFAGVKPGEKLGRDGEEKIVKAFEAYLREGKAPSIELSGPFARFRTWLTSIYRSISSLGVQPTDEIRQVFDRMLASEDDIAHAQEYYSRTGDVLSLIKADEAEKEQVKARLVKVRQSEFEKQARAYMKSYLQAIGGVSAIRAEAKKAVEENPVYKAIETAKDGKIDEDDLRETLGQKGFNEFTEKFPNLVKKNGDHTLASLAAEHGFESPESLGDNLMASVPKGEAVKNYTNRLVAEKDDQIRAEITKKGASPADGVMHTEGSLAYLIAETNLMAKQLEKGKPVRIDAHVFRDAAKQAIGDMKVKRAIRYADFAKTEARLAKQVLDYAKKGQWEDALQARKKQIAQHAMVQEAIKVRDERNEIVRRFSPSKLEAKLKNVDNEYVDPVRQILSSYGLSDVSPKSPYDLNNLSNVDTVLFSQIPSWLLRGENKGDYRDLTWNQLQDVNNAARSVLGFGNDQRKSDLALEAKTIGEIVEKSVANMNALPDRTVRQLGSGALANAYTVALQKLDWLKSHVTKAQFLFKILDNFSEERQGKAGIMSQMFHGMAGAEHNQSEAQRKVYEEAKPHLEVLAKATSRLRKELGAHFSIPGVDKPEIYREKGQLNWSPEQLVAYMLNTGAEGNLSALKNSFGHGPEEIQRVASHFSADELHAVDGLRDSIGSMFDGLNETNFKLYNRNVEKVDAVPMKVTSKDGEPVEMKGGYWPLVFDHEINRLQGKMSEEDVLNGQIKAFMRTAKPEDGMTKSRVVGHSLAPRLDMGVFADHVDDTTRFIHMAPLLRDLDRVMQNPQWRQAAVSKVGANEYSQARDWLKYQANPGRKQTTDFMRGVDKVFDYTRSAATASALGLNFVAGLKWRTSMLNSVIALGGWRHIINGYAGLGTKGLGTSTLGLSNTETWKMIEGKSKLLGPREAKGIRDLRDDVEKLKWDQTTFKIPLTDKTFTVNDLKHAMYEWAKMNDRAVVAPVWMGAYMKYRNEMGDAGMTEEARENAAISYADGIIQSSQPSSLNVDQNSILRNQNAAVKLFTMFMSYPYTIANRFMYQAKALQAGAITKQQYTSHVIHEVLLEPIAREAIKYAALGTTIPAFAYALGPVSNLVSGIPGLSTLFNVAQNQFGADELSPAFDVFRKIKNVYSDVVHSKDFVQLAWDVGRLTSYLTRIPALNVVKTLLDFHAEAKGQKQPLK